MKGCRPPKRTRLPPGCCSFKGERSKSTWSDSQSVPLRCSCAQDDLESTSHRSGIAQEYQSPAQLPGSRPGLTQLPSLSHHLYTGMVLRPSRFMSSLTTHCGPRHLSLVPPLALLPGNRYGSASLHAQASTLSSMAVATIVAVLFRLMSLAQHCPDLQTTFWIHSALGHRTWHIEVDQWH